MSTKRKSVKDQTDLKEKEGINVKEVAILLDCSIATVYGYIYSGKIKPFIWARHHMIRIKRSEIDKLFSLVK